MAEREPCPGCSARGFTVALGTMLPCGRCHGMGSIDPYREAIDRDKRERETQARVQRRVDETVALLRQVQGDDG